MRADYGIGDPNLHVKGLASFAKLWKFRTGLGPKLYPPWTWLRSFTVKHPMGSIGVVLNSRTFYVNRVQQSVSGPVSGDRKGGASVPWGVWETDGITRACL